MRKERPVASGACETGARRRRGLLLRGDEHASTIPPGSVGDEARGTRGVVVEPAVGRGQRGASVDEGLIIARGIGAWIGEVVAEAIEAQGRRRWVTSEVEANVEHRRLTRADRGEIAHAGLETGDVVDVITRPVGEDQRGAAPRLGDGEECPVLVFGLVRYLGEDAMEVFGRGTGVERG